MEYTKDREMIKEEIEEFEKGKSYDQILAEDSYVSYIQAREMVETISNFGDQNDVNNAATEIFNIAEKYNINIPPGILNLLYWYEYLYYPAHAPKDTYIQIGESLKNIYLDVIYRLIDNNFEPIIASICMSGITETDEDAEDLIKNYLYE